MLPRLFLVLAVMVGSTLAFPSTACSPALLPPQVRMESMYEPMPLEPVETAMETTRRAPFVALRGGFLSVPEDNACKFLVVSASCLLAIGAAMFIRPDFAWKQLLFVDPVPAASDMVREMLATSLVSWGCAKLTIVRQGEKAAKDYCKLNLFPMALLVASFVKNGAGAPAVGCIGVFAAGCALFGLS